MFTKSSNFLKSHHYKIVLSNRLENIRFYTINSTQISENYNYAAAFFSS